MIDAEIIVGSASAVDVTAVPCVVDGRRVPETMHSNLRLYGNEGSVYGF